MRAFRSVGGTPFFTKAAQGSRLTTADDKELIDFVCTWGPAIHGHNPPRVREAIALALEKGTSFGTQGLIRFKRCSRRWLTIGIGSLTGSLVT